MVSGRIAQIFKVLGPLTNVRILFLLTILNLEWMDGFRPNVSFDIDEMLIIWDHYA